VEVQVRGLSEATITTVIVEIRTAKQENGLEGWEVQEGQAVWLVTKQM
jgi:hypothetical protein